jgi:hypothetical protein
MKRRAAFLAAGALLLGSAWAEEKSVPTVGDSVSVEITGASEPIVGVVKGSDVASLKVLVGATEYQLKWAQITSIARRGTLLGREEDKEPTLIAVCKLSGDGLPASAITWLSQMVAREVDRSRLFATATELVDCGTGVEAALSKVRESNASLMVIGEIAGVADVFAVRLSLFDVESGVVEREETIELLQSPLDPRFAIRVAAQRLLGTGGHRTLPESHINISSSPPGASVFVEGLLEGYAPMTAALAPGSHTVRVESPGYSPWSLGVRLMDGETLSLNANLNKTLTATRSKSEGGKVLLGFTVPYVVAVGEASFYLLNMRSKRPYLGWLLVSTPSAYYMAANKVGSSDVDIGRAWATVSSGLWGVAWGILGVGSSGENSARPYVLTSLGTSLLGLYGTYRATEETELSRKRVGLINTGGFMGSMVGLGIPYLLDVEKPRVYNLSLLAGGMIGIVATTRLTVDLDYVEGPGLGSHVTFQPFVTADSGSPVRSKNVPERWRKSTRYGMSLSWRM